MTRDWFRYAAIGRGVPGDGFILQGDRMLVPKPGPDEVVIAVCGEDGVRASTVVREATLAEDGIMPSLLAGLADTQAEVRARKEAG